MCLCVCLCVCVRVFVECGGVIRKRQGHLVLESYPTNARCEWTIQVDQLFTIEFRWAVRTCQNLFIVLLMVLCDPYLSCIATLKTPLLNLK